MTEHVSRFFHGEAALLWPLVALVVFIAVFVGAVVWVSLGKRRYDEVARLPLEEGDRP